MKKVKCKRCDYEWESKSNLNYITCPSCLRKVEINDNNVKGGIKDGSK